MLCNPEPASACFDDKDDDTGNNSNDSKTSMVITVLVVIAMVMMTYKSTFARKYIDHSSKNSSDTSNK